MTTVLRILFACAVLFPLCNCGLSMEKPAHPTARYVSPTSISLSGATLNDLCSIDNSKSIILGFNRVRASSDSDISLMMPAGENSFSVTKDGAIGWVDGVTDTTGSFIVVMTMNPGFISIFDFGEAAGTSLFVFTIESSPSVPVSHSDWDVWAVTNADMQFVRAVPRLDITYPEEVFSEETGIVLDGSACAPLYSGAVNPSPTLSSFSWIQTAGPAVTLNGAATATPTFTAPEVAVETDLEFRLTVVDDAGLTATGTITIPVLAP